MFWVGLWCFWELGCVVWGERGVLFCGDSGMSVRDWVGCSFFLWVIPIGEGLAWISIDSRRDFVLGLLQFGRELWMLLGIVENWCVLESCRSLLFMMSLFCVWASEFCSFLLRCGGG